MTLVDFNVNYYVRVRLTEHGRSVHRRQHEALLGHLSHSCQDEFPYVAPKEDDEGWSRWQLWTLLKTFGPHIWMTGEMCFATAIKLETQ